MPWNYVDATNLSVHERRQWIKMAKSFGYEMQAVFFDVPLEVCLDRNRQRDRIGKRRHHAQNGRKAESPAFRRGLRENHRGQSQERELIRSRKIIALKGHGFSRANTAQRQSRL